MFLKKNRWLSLILTILITIEIFWFSSMTGAPAGVGGNVWIPRIYHFTVFFLFTFFLFTTIKGKQKLKLKHLLIVLAISIAHSFLDEFHQTFIPFRDSSIRDVLTDTIGIFFAVLLYVWSWGRR